MVANSRKNSRTLKDVIIQSVAFIKSSSTDLSTFYNSYAMKKIKKGKAYLCSAYMPQKKSERSLLLKIKDFLSKISRKSLDQILAGRVAWA